LTERKEFVEISLENLREKYSFFIQEISEFMGIPNFEEISLALSWNIKKKSVFVSQIIQIMKTMEKIFSEKNLTEISMNYLYHYFGWIVVESFPLGKFLDPRNFHGISADLKRKFYVTTSQIFSRIANDFEIHFPTNWENFYLISSIFSSPHLGVWRPLEHLGV
jgi:hypothetical protein